MVLCLRIRPLASYITTRKGYFIMTKLEKLQEWFEEASANELLSLIHDLVSYNGMFSDIDWYYMDELDYLLENRTPTEIIDMVANSEFTTCDPYFKIDETYGTLESGEEDDVVDDIRLYEAEIIDELLLGPIPINCISNAEIRDILKFDDDDE